MIVEIADLVRCNLIEALLRRPDPPDLVGRGTRSPLRAGDPGRFREWLPLSAEAARERSLQAIVDREQWEGEEEEPW